MRRTLLSILALMLTIAAGAQTLKIMTSSNTYSFSASDMTESSPATFLNGSTVTINGTTINLSDITSMTVGDEISSSTDVDANTVNIVYNGSSATVTAASNVSAYVSASVSGAHVTITQSNTDAVDGDEITYVLSGSTADGSLTLEGSYKCTVSLAGVTLANPSGAAINIANSKRIQLSAKKDTENTLTDGSGSQKACIYSKGQLQLQGNGTLNVVSNLKHGIKSASYIEIKNLTLNITSAVGDGINCEEYFLMNSGTVNISGTQDDGIQCDLGGTTSTGETIDHEDEDTGNIYISGGTITVNCTATAAKGIKCEGDMDISGGTVNVTTTGSGTWDSDDLETKAACGLSADGNMTIGGGTLTLTATGSGGKGMKCDGILTVSDGTITVKTTGGLYYNNGTTENTNYTGDTDNVSSDYYSSPKGIKAGVKTQSGNSYTYSGGIVISGGTISVTTNGHNAEGLESKNTLNIADGHLTVNAYDDAINSAQDMTISGGYVYARATNNDGIDSNGDCYINGGIIVAIGASGAEVAIDANSEDHKQLYVTGGTLVAIGGLEQGSSLTQSCYSASTWSSNTWYAMTYGSETFAFKTPSSGGTPLVVSAASTPTLNSGVTVSSGTSIFDGAAYAGATVSGGSSVSLSSYTGGNSGGGNQPGGGDGSGGGNQPGGGGPGGGR